MRKKVGLFIIFFLLLFIPNVNAKETKLYLFHSESCPHCKEEIKFLDSIKDEYEDLEIIKYEVSKNEENYNFYKDVLDKTGINAKGVPFTLIGTDYYSGYSTSIGENIKKSIEKNIESGSKDVISMIKNNEDISDISFNTNNNNLNLYIFHQNGCPHCEKELEFLKKIEVRYPKLNILKYEVSKNEENYALYQDIMSKTGINGSSVPFTLIGTDYYIGFSEEEEKKIESSIKKFIDNESLDIVKMIDEGKDVSNIKFNETYIEEKSITIFGHEFKFDARNVSLPIISCLIGLVDGFNPCAMWILLFLISMLLNMKDKKKQWILGLAFLITSALVYVLIMTAWLKVALSFNTVKWLKILIALVALIGGGVNIYNYIKTRNQEDGCTVVDEKERKKTFKKIKKIVSEEKFILALIGIIALAVSVNLVELACSAGLPLIFTQILALNELSTIEYALYMFLYMLFFLIDDILVFTISMVTLNVTGISGKYNKYSHLIGGIIMIIIGILMIFKPGWLMFNFS